MQARIARVAALTAVVVFAVACTKTLDTSSLETDLAHQLESDLGLTSVQVSCPDSLKVQAGTSFTCTAKGPDSAFEITVTQDDDQGNVGWKFSGATPSPAAPSASPSA